MKTKRLKKIKEKMTLNPIMTFLILIAATIVISGILSLLGFEATYSKINTAGDYTPTLEVVESLFSLSGLKFIFSQTISNFASFAPLVNLIIVLFGIGIMEKSGFLRTAFTLLTKYTKKNTVTFVFVLICVVSSLGGDLGYVVMIPLSALLYLHGKRNPLVGIITAFAALACGSGLSLLFTAQDSALLQLTLQGAAKLDVSYTIASFSMLFIMAIAVIVITLLITRISEAYTSQKIGKYDFTEYEEEEHTIAKKELKGLIFGLGAGLIYILIFIYCIIPDLPFSGTFLDNSNPDALYIDKLFGYDSFFSNGFVFIITILFIIWGLFYGLGAKTIKNNNDIANYLGHSLDGIGKPIALIFLASTFISVFKKTNIGNVITALFANVIEKTSFQGIPLIILLFVIVALVTLVLPSSTSKWAILSGVTVPVMMNAGLSPEFTQVIFRFGESFTMGITPLLAYFVIYLAYLEKYNQDDKPIPLVTSLKHQLPYSLATGGILLLLLIIWYLIGVPIGIGGSAVL